MVRVSKIVTCVDCGRKFPRKELNRKLRCKDCGMAIIVANMTGLMRHEGPHYEKWKKSIKQAARRL